MALLKKKELRWMGRIKVKREGHVYVTYVHSILEMYICTFLFITYVTICQSSCQQISLYYLCVAW
jgi:hypothetical protein